MPDDSLHSPHDRFFKETFGRRDTAASFFQSYLPPEIVARIDWSALALEPGSHVHASLREQCSDLLYSVRFHREPLFLYLLFEHQNQPERWMALRFHDYMGGIWNGHRKAHAAARKLPPILPIVLSQGGPAWRPPVQFSELMEMPSPAAEMLRPFVPDFRYHLIDLSQIPPGRIRGSALARVALELLKGAREGRLLEALERVLPLIVELARGDEPTRLLEALLTYVYSVNDTISREAVSAILAKAPDPTIERMHMSIADQLRQEGREEGRRMSLRENILEILNARLGPVSFEVSERVAVIEDEKHLRQILLAAASADTVESFAAAL